MSSQQQSAERLVSVAQAARETGLGYGALRGLIHRRQVPTVRVGDKVLIRPSALKAAIEER